MRRSIIVVLAAGIVSLGALAGADGHINEKQLETAVKARQAHMQIYSFHLATLGGMAKDEIAYDVATAQTAYRT